MKIATYNINGINGRLEILLRWLNEANPDIVCLQELKTESHQFPEQAIKDAGYNSIWQGQKSWNGVAILAKAEIKELRNDLPGHDDEFTHSRYIEAFVNGIVIGCIYLPNGNPWPGPKFDYKLRWFQRLADHAEDLVNRELPVILIGDYNVMPAELDTLNRRSISTMPCTVLKRAKPIKNWLIRVGRMPSVFYIRTNAFIRFGII